MHILSSFRDALSMAFAMFWEILWALILGFTLSGIVQAVVSKSEMGRSCRMTTTDFPFFLSTCGSHAKHQRAPRELLVATEGSGSSARLPLPAPRHNAVSDTTRPPSNFNGSEVVDHIDSHSRLMLPSQPRNAAM
jgi:hypothetical protein